MHSQGDILILGLGNEALSDDGIGLKLVKELEKRAFSDRLRYHCQSLVSLDLIENLHNINHLLIIDSVKTSRGVPGTVTIYNNVEDFTSSHTSNYHDISIQTVLLLGQTLGLILPKRYCLITIEVSDDLSLSLQLSKLLSGQFKRIFELVYGLLKVEICSEKVSSKVLFK